MYLMKCSSSFGYLGIKRRVFVAMFGALLGYDAIATHMVVLECVFRVEKHCMDYACMHPDEGERYVGSIRLNLVR